MFHTRQWAKAVFLLSILMGCRGVMAQETVNLSEVQALMRQACPEAWEEVYSEIEYQSGQNIWSGNISDKAQFIKFASAYLKTPDGRFLIKNFDDAEAIIYECGGLHYAFFEEALRQAQEDYVMYTTILGNANDLDQDGVENDLDQCANTQVGEVVDANGCALSQLDSDGDGVNDAIDQCADTLPTDTANTNGCALDQIDSDGDGTADYLDAYPQQNSSQCFP